MKRSWDAVLASFDRDPIRSFWNWFEEHAADIDAEVRAYSGGGPQPIFALYELGDRLRRIDERLVHEIGVHPQGEIELIVSASGVLEAFGSVTKTIAQAPQISGFRYTAFRPRRVGWGDTVVIESLGKVTADQLSYASHPEGLRLGLTVYLDVPGPTETRDMAVFLMLDAALGEYDVETGIGSIEISREPPPGAKPWTDLPAEFDRYREPLARA